MKDGVYTIFLTQAAVAWFAAGVVAPVFNQPKNMRELAAYIFSTFMAVVFVYVAYFLGKRGRR